jgi:EAL domain-containing protein (putative c-di-GMP-specific phosphodiesterase class I)
VEPSLLTLEITESMLMKRLDSALENMNRLRNIGVGLSVDDFGTGYSSLSYLSTLPITSLKIDRSFVQKLQNESRNGEVVRAIVTLGVALGKTVIAEGIETPAELNQLRALGCGYGQGYLLARPLTAETCELLLQGEDRAMQAAAALDPSRANEPIDRPAWSVTHH